jgi:DNA mismatch endonuclease (patch repair protein)
MDTVDKATRSRIMSKVAQRDTGPELQIRRALHGLGFRYRLNVRGLPGTPDLVLPKYHAAIFVHGCFWHAHGCRLSKIPETRSEFWKQKFADNRARDKRAVRQLQAKGWRVLIVWQCAIKGKKAQELERTVNAIASWLRSQETYRYIP